MNRPMDHEECSEHLRTYVLGILAAPEAQAVRDHLGTCDRCRAEERALTELLEPSAPLTATESDDLRAAVPRDVRRPASLSDHAPRRAPRQASWKGMRWLAAAALLVGGVVVVRNGWIGSGGDDQTVALGGAEAVQVADIQDRLSFRRPERDTSLEVSSDAVVEGAPLEATADEAPQQQAEEFGAADQADTDGDRSGAGAAKRSAVGSDYRGPPRPLFVRDAGRLSDRKLTLVGRYGLPLVLFPSTYTTADANDRQEDFLVALSNAAETEADGRQIIDCGAQVLSQAGAVLPGLATFGDMDGTRVFVLVLAWTDADEGPLDRYMVWTWPAGDCNSVPGYRAGRIGV